jgi:hypothetical protein
MEFTHHSNSGKLITTANAINTNLLALYIVVSQTCAIMQEPAKIERHYIIKF